MHDHVGLRRAISSMGRFLFAWLTIVFSFKLKSFFTTIGFVIRHTTKGHRKLPPKQKQIGCVRRRYSACDLFTSHTFSSCGKQGADGPTLAECQSAYTGAPWASDASKFTVSAGRAALPYLYLKRLYDTVLVYFTHFIGHRSIFLYVSV